MNLRHTLATLGLAASVAIGGSSALAQTDIFAELEESAQEVRQLELLQPLNVTVKSRAELQQEQLDSLEDDFPADDTADWNSVLVFLGYIEPGDDMAEIYTSLMGDQILGYYSPVDQALVVVQTGADGMSATDKSTFVHETTHALQDQHYDLIAIQGGDEASTDDFYFARTALIEGDATLAETIYMVQEDLIDQIIEEQSGMDSSAVDAAPFFLTESLYFPYTTGAEFVMFVWTEGGWQAVNAVWENPPTTSEQIIHPEKYVDGEGAIPVAIADPLETFGPDWRLLEYNENGELGVRIFLQNSGATAGEAEVAAAGWGGDATYIITNDDETAMVWTTAWDTDSDADEFFETLVSAEADRLGATFEPSDGTTVTLTGNGWNAQIVHDGTSVTYYLTQSDATLATLIASQDAATPQPSRAPGNDATPIDATPAAAVFWLREV